GSAVHLCTSMDARLPADSRRRYQKSARRASDKSGVLVVAIAVASFLFWLGQAAIVDLHALVSVPDTLGLTMYAQRPVRSRVGRGAPAPPPPATATFTLGMAELKAQLGPIMGEPRECEHPVDSDGNTVQLTSTGRATFIQRTQTLMFTNGWRTWALNDGK